MSDERGPEQVVRRYLDAVVAGDREAMRASFTDDATWTVMADVPIAGPWHGPDEIIDGFFGTVGPLFEQGSHSFDFPTILAAGDTVAIEWRVEARTVAGEPYENDYSAFVEVRDGKIAAFREYLDSGYASRVLLVGLE